MESDQKFADQVVCFKEFTGQADDSVALGFLQKGKGNLELALNYYFQQSAGPYSQLRESSNQSQMPGRADESQRSAFLALEEGAKERKSFEERVKQIKKEYSSQITSSITQAQEKLELKREVTCTVDNLAGFYRVQNATRTHDENSSMNIMDERPVDFKKKLSDSKEEESQKQAKNNLKRPRATKIQKKQNPTLGSFFDSVQRKSSQKQNHDFSTSDGTFPLFLGIISTFGLAIGIQERPIVGSEVYLRREKPHQAQTQLKNTKKTKTNHKNTIIRIDIKDKEFGKLDPDISSVLSPLLDRNYIAIQSFVTNSPFMISTFSKVEIELKVFLTGVAGSQAPITKLFNINSEETALIDKYCLTKQEFFLLFALLKLEKKHSATIKQEIFLPKFVSSSANNKSESKKEQKSQNEETQRKNSSKIAQVNIFDPFSSIGQAKITSFTKKPKESNESPQIAKANSSEMIIEKENEETKGPPQMKSGASNEKAKETQVHEVLDGFGHHELNNLSEPKETFASKLHDYQKQALTWMLSREKQRTMLTGILKKNGGRLHPFWEEYLTIHETSLYFNSFTGQVSVHFPGSIKDCVGGILADEMGLGKTVMMIALIHTNKLKKEQENIQETLARDSVESKRQKKVLKKILARAESFNQRKGYELDSLLDLIPEGNASKLLENSEEVKEEEFVPSRFASPSESEEEQNENIEAKESQGDLDFSSMNDSQGNRMKKANTLIVLPVTLITQWESELNKHSNPGSLKVCKYYDIGSRTKKEQLCKKLSAFDVVLTSYGALAGDFSQKLKDKRSVTLYSLNWFRIILDEAHYIKGRVTNVAKAAFALKGQSRWCLTGTPFQNKLDELFSLMHFIRLEPWCDYQWWNQQINKQMEIPERSSSVFEILQTILSEVMLRRTKKTSAVSLGIPEKYCHVDHVEFSEPENRFYEELSAQAKEKLGALITSGTILKQYMHVFEILLRLRQACDHLFLLRASSNVKTKEKLKAEVEKFIKRRLADHLEQALNDEKSHEEEIIVDEETGEEIHLKEKQEVKFNHELFEEVAEKLEKEELIECVICLSECEDPVITTCMHVYCRSCLVKALDEKGYCPLCRMSITCEDWMTVPRDSMFSFDVEKNFKRSAKMEQLHLRVKEIMERQEKAVIFSQFLGMLMLIGIDLSKNGFPFCKLDGSMNLSQRSAVLEDFQNTKGAMFLLVSLRTGGVGLNLVAANNVILVDPWWNPAVEEQAIDRVHRIGQKKPVNVYRLICRGTIEERVMALHEQKREMFNSIVTSGVSATKMISVENIKFLLNI